MKQRKRIKNERRRRAQNNQKYNREIGLRDLIPAYPGQPVFQCRIQSQPLKLTTTVTTGVISNATVFNVANLAGFSTRFAAWSEYRVVQIDVKINMFSSTTPGFLRFWIDEQSSTAPSATAASYAFARSVNLSSVDKAHHIHWLMSDPDDAGYSPISTGVAQAYLKIYTNNADYGAPIVATDVAFVEATYVVQFRGFSI